jgi:ribonuclease HII
MPDFNFEYEAIGQGLAPVVGVDEAGRGPWAGPVVAGAAILDIETLPESLRLGLDDSKKLKAEKREILFDLLLAHAKTGVGIASVQEIDKINILQATMLAMKRAVEDLGITPGMVLVDGNRLPDWPYASQAIIKGDLAQDHPQYGWERNAGYGTKQQQQGLVEFGICQHHRRSFKPIRKILGI